MDRQRRIEGFLHAGHRLAAARLRAEPDRVANVRAQLQRWRSQSGRARSHRCWDEWELLLAMPIDDFACVVCGDDEHAVVLRSVPPIGVLISEAERAELLRRARGA